MGETLSSKCVSMHRAMSSTRSLEQHHFNIAAMQYCNLLNKNPIQSLVLMCMLRTRMLKIDITNGEVS